MTRRATVLDRIEPEAFAHINPDDLTQWNLVPGEEIRVRHAVVQLNFLLEVTQTCQQGSSSFHSVIPKLL